MAKKKHGDRRDGIWLRDLPAMNQIMTTIMPNRADNEAYIDVDVDLRPLEAYLAKKNEGRTEDKITFFHVITAAIGKAFVLRPRMNRFICNHYRGLRGEEKVRGQVRGRTGLPGI